MFKNITDLPIRASYCCTLLKNNGSLFWHEEPLTSMEPFHSTKGYLWWKMAL